MANVDDSMLRAALIGYEHMLGEIQEKIADIQGQLGRGRTVVATSPDGAALARKRKPLSAAARRRIAAAQRKRWKSYHEQQREAPAKPSAQRRKPVSAEVRTKRIAALAKARAAKAAKRAAAKG